MTKINSFHIFALAAHGEGMSGSDRIFIELARNWGKKLPIYIYLWGEGVKMCERQNLKSPNIKFQISNLGIFSNAGFFINYLARIVEGFRLGLTLKLENKPNIYIYNASEFWMDSIPCVILKLRHPKTKWIATWFQTAPNPLRGYAEHSTKDPTSLKLRGTGKEQRAESYKLSALFYWFSQIPVKPLIKKYADKVIVNNEDEREQFPKMERKGKVIVLLGAVRLDDIEKFKTQHTKHKTPTYNAVFQGRFHPQKGVVELIDIWKKVVKGKPDAKLAMIGDGPLYKNVEERIMKYGLERNIKLFGYVFDGPKKYSIFHASKIVVHPAFYDSGGMASAEAMAFGLPAVGFNLKAYESYYPGGMTKVKKGNLDLFAKAILSLLDNDEKYRKMSKEAYDMISKGWSWDTRSSELLDKIIYKF